MFASSTTLIGIDPTAGHKPFTYAALDWDLHLLALGQGSLHDILAFAAGQRQAVVAVSAPRRPNLGLLNHAEIRQQLDAPPRPGRWVDFRLAEYLLRRHNIMMPRTRAQEAECPAWMQMGFELHRRLEALGYLPYAQPAGGRCCLEVYPHACYTVLMGLAPFPKGTLEGRIQRQLVLYENKVKVPDPMNFFEEITRHRLLKGLWPTEGLHSQEELDALVSAYTAWRAVKDPDQVVLIGDPQEGQIVVPISELKLKY